MPPTETIPRALVLAVLGALGVPLGEPFNRTMVVHIAGDHISYELAEGDTILWRRIVDECTSCHATTGQPHTEYCQVARRPVAEPRPDDDPADEITCDGRNCGGKPHA